MGVLAVTLRVPAALVAVWGGFYVVRCAQTLTAPGVPIEYRYESEAGTMLAKADSYQFDLSTMQGFVNRVKLFGPEGKLVAATETLDFAIDGKTFVLRMADPVINVHRLADGTFDIAKMIPKKEEEKEYGGAFRLAVKSATVNYTDDFSGSPPVQIFLKGVEADGAEGSFLFHGRFEGALRGEAAGDYNKGGRLWASVQFDKSDVAPLLPIANATLDKQTFGEFADVSAKTLVLDGRAQLWLDPDTGAQITGEMNVDATGLRSKETLRSTRLVATLVGEGRSVRAKASAQQPGLDATFDGTFVTFGDSRMTGGLTAKAEARGSLPPILAQFIDPGVTFSGAGYDGKLDTDGTKYIFDGAFGVDQAEFGGETATGVAGRVRLTQDHLVAQIDKGAWSGLDVSGGLSVDFASGALDGGLRSERGRLEPLAQHLGTDRLKGILSLSAVIGGTVKEPFAEIYGRGSGAVQVAKEGQPTSIGVFEARGRMDGDGISLERLTSTGDNGVLTAQGSMKWADGALNVQVQAGGLDVSAASHDVKGLGFLKASIVGTRDAPIASGRLEIYGLEAFDRNVPQVIADWRADKDRLTLDRFAARAGTGQIDGTGTLAWADKALDAQFSGSGVRLEEWLAREAVGSLIVEDGRIGGTLDDPKASATLRAEQVFFGGVDVDKVLMKLEADKTSVRSPLFSASSSGGDVSGSAAFEIGSRTGTLQAKFNELPLSKIPLSDYSLALDGLASGDLSLGFGEKGLTSGLLNSDLTYIAVNGTAVGQGSLTASLEGSKVKADAQVGSLERYVLLSGGSFDIDSHEVGGELLAFNILMQDVIEAVHKSTVDWPSEVKGILDNSTGLANADVSVSGDVKNPNVDVRTLGLTGLTLRGRAGGELHMKGARHDGEWTLDDFKWQNGDTTFAMSGKLSEKGDASLDGKLTAFQAPWLNTLFPDMPLIAGIGDAEFTLRGSLSDPKGSAKIDATGLGLPEWPAAQTIALKDVRLSVEDMLMEMTGDVQYQALKGKLSGLVPYSSLVSQEGVARQPMNLQVDLSPTQFADFAPYIASLDPARSIGTVEGSAWIVGLWGEFTTHAELRAKGTSLAVASLQSPVKDIDLTARWDNGSAWLKGQFAGEVQGKGTLDVQAMFPDLFSGSTTVEDVKRETTLNGALTLEDFRTRFTLPTAERASRATIDTKNLKLAGTLGEPVLTGDVVLSELYVRLPKELSENKEAVVFPIDPHFDGVTVRAMQGSQLDSGTARIDFFGTGRLGGSLQNPDVSVPLTVTGGVFEMPTARITVESGGSINVGYHGVLGAAPTARVDLDLEGRTTISARRLQNEYETYLVTLSIRGNLLDEHGLLIQASSDPPDLTSDQILAVLGQKDLIESFARHGSDMDFRESLYTVALPTAANIFTSGIARDLGLDYIALDYNPFDQAVASAGKTVARGLMVQGSRQLTQSVGERLKYEVQLTYRLPMQDAFFSKVRLSLGLDQDVPWRIRLGWGRRF